MKNSSPRFWGSLEELETPSVVDARAHQEFLAPPPKQDITGMERRDFLKLIGATMFVASLGCSRRPVEKIIPYVNKPEEVTPGVANWYASTCGECSAGCGTLVKTREARPIKIEGNELHPLNQGGLCGRGQASLLNLYNPDRIRVPHTILRGDGSHAQTNWEAMDNAIRERLATLQKNGDKFVLLTGTITSPTTKALIADFIARFQNAEHIVFEGVVPEEIALGQELAYGTKLTPRYRFDQAAYIVSFGADFLGTWLSPVEFAKGFSKARRADEGKMARFVCFESTLSLTGTNADEYIALAPGNELVAALALAHELIVKQGHSNYAHNAVLTQTLVPYSIDTVAPLLGLEANLLRKIAHELWEARGKSIVVGGGVKAKQSVLLQVAVNLLNTALENDGGTIDWETPSSQAQSSYADLLRLTAEMKQKKIGALFIAKGDPAFTLPQELGFTQALKQVPLVVNFTDTWNETARVSTHICPDTHPLESWNDASPQAQLYSITQPVIAPLYENRSFQDSLITWGTSSAANWHEYLKTSWQKNVFARTGKTVTFEAFWEETLTRGFIDLRNHGLSRSSSRAFRVEALRMLPPLQKKADLTLSLYPSVALYDGRAINNGWLLELPDPVAKIAWDNFLSIAPQTAKALGIAEGDVLDIEAKGVRISLPAHLQPKLHPQTLTAAVGYGQTLVGRIGDNIGSNVYPLQEKGSNLPEWAGLRVKLTTTGRHVKLACVQGHHDLERRAILFDTTWEEFKKNPSAGIEAPEKLPTMWPVHEYKKQRWGMAIDLNSCIGCSACMIGCQAENNIPVVGRDQVVKGREMHWLRIDRYYSGPAHNPDVVHQPMLCQQCENAPCETVCPTLATFHSDDGLNMMTYNRCVGTRYCSNNCPYKVRRFNYFQYSDNLDDPQQLALNPDVTVRTRGIMEKCTFCIQRIQEKRNTATIAHRDLEDGEIKTACQQSCPANAIVFGDLNDPESRVSKLATSERGFHVLADLNTRPAVTYTTKIRNKT